MRPRKITLTMAAVDADGIAQAQAVAGAGNLTLDGALVTAGVAVFDVPRHVEIDSSSASDTSQTATFTGTDRFGNTITEAIALNGTTAVAGTKNFKTVTQVAISAVCVGNINAGTAAALESQWIPVSRFADSWTLEGVVSAGGSLTWGVQYAVEKLQDDGLSEATRFLEGGAAAITHATLSAKTASTSGVQETPVTGFRVALSGWSSGSLDFHVVER